MKHMKKVKNDLVILTGIILCAVLLWFIPNMIQIENPGVVKVLQEGKEVASYSLAEDQTISLSDEEGGYNLLLISNGEVSVSDADCPDRLCVGQKSISRNGESIICLPHKLVIRIEAKENSELDAVTY